MVISLSAATVAAAGSERSQETPAEKTAANDFIIAYQRASSFASKDVLKGIEDYFTIWRKPMISMPEEMPEGYHEELALHNALLRHKVDTIF